MSPQRQDQNQETVSSPLQVLSVAFTLTIFLFVTLGWLNWSSYTEIGKSHKKVRKILELKGLILQYDEVLTMSAKMASATGDLYWEKRYRSFEPQLDMAIKELVAIEPDAFTGEAARRTGAANIKLVAMENQAFNLIRQGRADEAQFLLRSKDYENEKSIYSSGMQQVKNYLENQEKLLSEEHRKRGLFAIVAVIVDIPLILFAWFVTHRSIKMYISKRKNAEEKLRESRKRFRELAELLPETIFEIAIDGTVTFVNRMAFEHFRYTKKDFERGLKALDMIVPEDRSRTMENMRKILAGENFGLTEYRALRKDGTTFPVLFHSTPIIRDGHPVGLRGFIIDISEKKQLENQLLQSQKMEAIGTLAGGIAHDFNNILTAILGYSEMLQEDCPAGSTMRNDIDCIVEASHRAKELVKQILAFSRQAETDEMVLQPTSIIKEAVKMIRASMPSTIDIQQDIDEDVGLIFADPIQIHQIITNLCTNAFHAMEETGGILNISLKNKELALADFVNEPHVQPGHFIEISVGDTGPGIAPELMDKIFDPFFTTKEVGKGTGMGLAIIHGIAKKAGGFVVCKSSPGQGTAFLVYLPVHADTAPPEAEKTSAELAQTGIERILFIDDEEMLAKMGKTMLERLGYRVTVETNSIEALKNLQSQPDRFDLVITDQTMPGMTGIDLARRILQIHPDLPIILCTGFSNMISKEKARNYGIKGFAMKPLAQKDLASLVRKVLDGDTGTV